MQIYLMKNIVVTFFFQHVSPVIPKANLKPHENNQFLRFFAGTYPEKPQNAEILLEIFQSLKLLICLNFGKV
jgi:hypothetical protein